MKAAKRKIEAKTQAAAPAAGAAWWWKPAIGFLALILLFQVYGPALDGPYFFDDPYLIPLEDTQFAQRSLGFVMRMFRPLFNLSFWLTSNLIPGAAAPQHHVVNVWLHFFNGVLMFAALRKLLGRTAADDVNIWLAAFGAGVFLLHPVQTESVAYISGRSESLCLLWFLGAFNVFLSRREAGIGWGASAATIALFGAAVASKEHAAVLPVLLVLTDWLSGGWEAVKRNWRLYAPMLILALLGGAMVARVLMRADTAGFGLRDLPWYQYFFTEWRAIWVYLRLFVLPVGLNADYAYPVSRTVMDHGALFGLIGLAALSGAAFYWRKRFSLAFYGWLVFLLLIAPTSSVIPIRDALAERRLYLPFLGLLLILCDLLRHWKAPLSTRGPAFGAVLLVLAWMTYARASVWASPMALWEDSIAKSPHNSRAHFQRASLLQLEGKCEEARQGYAAANKAGNRESRLFTNWALVYDCLNQPEKAIEKLRESFQVEDTAHAHSTLGMVLAKQRRFDESMVELETAIRMDPANEAAYTYRGNIYILRQEYGKAEADLERALSLNPSSEGARRSMAALRQRKGAAK